MSRSVSPAGSPSGVSASIKHHAALAVRLAVARRPVSGSMSLASSLVNRSQPLAHDAVQVEARGPQQS
jgi:hypothetical protein